MNLPAETQANLPDTKEIARPVFGPMMLKLTSKQRNFVLRYLDGSGNRISAIKAAGYETASDGAAAVMAHNLLHNPKILDAIKEVAGNEIRAASIGAMQGLTEIANNPEHKDRLKACIQLLDRADVLMPEHRQRIVVEDLRSDKELIEFIKEAAKEQGLDPKVLLGRAGIEIVTADFEMVEDEEWTT